VHPDDLTAIIFWYVAVFLSIVLGASYSVLRSSRFAPAIAIACWVIASLDPTYGAT